MTEIILALVSAGLGAYFGTYIREKAKGLATKEDIGAITTVVESIKQANAAELAELSEELRIHGSMRQAALEKRLAVHQEAYGLSNMMVRELFSDNRVRNGLAQELREWWIRNCLYLDAEPRSAFDAAWGAFMRHPTLMDRNNDFEPMAVTDNFALITRLARALEEATALPPILLDRKMGLPEEAPNQR